MSIGCFHKTSAGDGFNQIPNEYSIIFGNLPDQQSELTTVDWAVISVIWRESQR